MKPEEYILIDLASKCERRTTALLKAVDALEEIRDILFKSKRRWDDRQRLLYTICNAALEQIDLFTKDTNGKGEVNYGLHHSVGGKPEKQ